MMSKTMNKTLLPIILLAVLPLSCTGFLDPLPNGSYNSTNYQDYPKLIAGYIDKAYELLPNSYLSDEFIGMDAASDDAIFREETAQMHQLSRGITLISNYPLSSCWERDYKALYYVNLFLEDGTGIRQHYKVDTMRDSVLRRTLQGDAYGLRAWYHFDLLRKFSGTGTDGRLLGISPMLAPTTYENEGIRTYTRQTFDESVATILRDCDSAIVYLPVANRDFLMDEGSPDDILGSVRYKRLDRASIHALKALVYLMWASPAFNPENKSDRWEKAAQEAFRVMEYKMTKENVPGGFDPRSAVPWTDPNAPEALWASNTTKNGVFEQAFYPAGFNGTAKYGPTQELADAFPMANGYPIADPRSGYDPARPYEGRDPRFYTTFFHHGASVKRNGTGAAMYTFDMQKGGKDAAGGVSTSPTNYYIRKYVYLGWNGYDNTVNTAPHCIFFLRWTEMVLAFAEAANRVAGPLDDRFGMSAHDAVAMLRRRPAAAGMGSIGAAGEDAYLEECSASAQAFEALVRNEWRLETCFEGQRLYHLFRWGENNALNAPLHRPVFEDGETPGTEVVTQRAYPALSLPIPATEMRKTHGMVQNKGWETWK